MMKRALFLALFLLLPLHAFAAQSIVSTTGTAMVAAAARYYTIQGVTTAQTNNTNALVGGSAPSYGTLGNLIFSAVIAPGVGESWLLTVMKNGASTTLTCNIINTNPDCSDNNPQHFVTYIPGDRLQVEIIGSAAAAGGSTGSWGMKNYPQTLGEQIFLTNHAATGVVLNGIGYAPFSNTRSRAWIATETEFDIWPESGTFDKYTIFTSQAPGSAKTVQWTLEKNFAASALTATQTGATTLTATDTVDSVGVVSGDILDYKFASTSNISSMSSGMGVRYKSSGQTTSVFVSSSWGGADFTNNRFMVLHGDKVNATTESAQRTILPQDLLFTTIVASTTDPSPGSRQFVLRVNGVSTGLSCTVPAGSTHCTGSGNVITRYRDLVDIGDIPTGSPATGFPVVATAAQEMHGSLQVLKRLNITGTLNIR